MFVVKVGNYYVRSCGKNFINLEIATIKVFGNERDANIISNKVNGKVIKITDEIIHKNKKLFYIMGGK